MKLRNIYNNALFVLMGIVVFSSMCSTISQNILHVPLTVPEILIIPFVLLRKEKFASLRFDKSQFAKWAILFLFLFIVALMWGVFDTFSIISCARCYFYILIGYCLFDTPNLITTEDIMYLSLGSIIGWAYVSYSNLQYLMYVRSDEYLTYGLFLALPLFYCNTLKEKDYKLLGIGMGFLVIVFMFAGIRRVIAVFLITVLSYSFISILGNPKKLFGSIVVLALIGGIFWMLLPWMEKTVMDLSPHLYYRLFSRMEGASGNNLDESDMTRISNLTLISNTDVELILPHGFNTTRYDTVKGSGVFNDVPIFSLAWIFSLPFTIVLLARIAMKFLKLYKHYILSKNQDYLTYLVIITCMAAMLFFDGTFLTYVYAAPITGYCLGKINLLSKS